MTLQQLILFACPSAQSHWPQPDDLTLPVADILQIFCRYAVDTFCLPLGNNQGKTPSLRRPHPSQLRQWRQGWLQPYWREQVPQKKVKVPGSTRPLLLYVDIIRRPPCTDGSTPTCSDGSDPIVSKNISKKIPLKLYLLNIISFIFLLDVNYQVRNNICAREEKQCPQGQGKAVCVSF